MQPSRPTAAGGEPRANHITKHLAPDEGPVLCVGCQRYCLAVCETLDPGPIEEADY